MDEHPDIKKRLYRPISDADTKVGGGGGAKGPFYCRQVP